MSEVLKPKDRPGHHAIGRIFTGYSSKHEKTAQYFCDSYDPRIGFWMTNVADPDDRKKSFRAGHWPNFSPRLHVRG